MTVVAIVFFLVGAYQVLTGVLDLGYPDRFVIAVGALALTSGLFRLVVLPSLLKGRAWVWPYAVLSTTFSILGESISVVALGGLASRTGADIGGYVEFYAAIAFIDIIALYALLRWDARKFFGKASFVAELL